MDRASLEKQFSKTHAGDLGIIGGDVSYSLSPAMHNPALKDWWKKIGGSAKGCPTYHLFSVASSELPAAVEWARAKRLRGFNVTVPYKEEICAHLNGLVGFAGRVRSVNTVRVLGGQTLGYNTDADGFLRALNDRFQFSPRDRSVLVLGAGGTGAVLIQALLDAEAKRVFYWNRSETRAPQFQGETNRLQRLRTEEINREIGNVDLVVNATSVGLKEGDRSPVDSLRFRKGQFVYDVVYNRATTFLREAKAAGAITADGKTMLLHQGALAFEIWTNAAAPLEIMRKGLNLK